MWVERMAKFSAMSQWFLSLYSGFFLVFQSQHLKEKLIAFKILAKNNIIFLDFLVFTTFLLKSKYFGFAHRRIGSGTN